MQDIMTAIIDNLNSLHCQFSDITRELQDLYSDTGEVSIHTFQILQADLKYVESQIAIASMVNCTPHPITIEGLGELPPSGILPRVANSYEDCLPQNNIRVRNKVGAGVVTGLPEPVEGLSFIVSGMVREALSLSDALSALPEFQSRPDVFAPDTGDDAIRNEKGHIVAVRGLVQ